MLQRGLRGAFAVALPATNHAVMHCLVRGKAVLAGVGDEPVTLTQGQIAVLPHQTPHTIADVWPPVTPAKIETPPSAGTIRSIDATDVAETLLLTLPFVLPSRAEHPMSKVLPMLKVLNVPHPQLIELVLLISKMAILPGPGDHYIASRLAEAVLTKTMQQLAGAEQDRFGVFALFASAGVKSALAAIRVDPTRPWSVGELAEIAQLSRTEFVAQWHDTIGSDVLGFVSTLRVRLAETLLLSGAAGLDELAARVGFRSDSSFKRAFLRVTGHSPSGEDAKPLAWLRRQASQLTG